MLIAFLKIPLGLGSLSFVVCLIVIIWFFGIESGLVPELVIHYLCSKASNNPKLFSLLFVDVSSEKERVREKEFDEFIKKSSDNSTIR